MNCNRSQAPQSGARGSGPRAAAVAVAAAVLAGSVRAAAPVASEPAGVRTAPGWELFAGTNIPAFSLELDAAAMQSLQARPREWVRGTLRWGGETFPEVGVHLKGSEGSLQPIDRRPSLTVSLHQFTPGRRLRGVRKIHFNNTAEDPSFMTEVLCSEFARRIGLPAARAAHATLRLNGRALGLYVLKEGLTKDFLAQYFGRTDGALYDGGFQRDIDQPFERIGGEGPEDQADRLALLAAAREPDPARRLARLRQVLDVDRFLSLLAFTTLTWNWDGYPMARNNYRIYHDPETDKLVFIPHGLDQMFWEPHGTIYPRWRGLVAAALMQTPEGRGLYRARLETVLTNAFHPDTFSRRLHELAALIEPHWPSAPARAAELTRRIAIRAESVARQLALPEPQPLSFQGQTARLTGWRPLVVGPEAALDETAGEAGAQALRIRHSRPGRSAWVTRVSLPAGQYEFVGRVRVLRCQAGPNEREAGAGLAVSLSSRDRAAPGRVGGLGSGGRQLVGDAGVASQRLGSPGGWEELRCQFAVPGPETAVALACEFLAAAGEVWFEGRSLQLRRLAATSRSGWWNWLRR